MIKLAFFAGLGLLITGLTWLAYYVRAGIERDAELDAAAIRDRPTFVLAALPPARTMAEIASDGVPAELVHTKTLDEWLAEPARVWSRDHAVRTAAMFAGYEHDRADAWDDWLNGHLRALGFADLDAVNAEMDAELARGVDRMIAWTTETAEWSMIKASVPA